jgi:hypothetical protein
LRDLNEGRELPYFGVVYATVGDNPRKVKRLCRGLELAFDMMQLALGRPLPPTSQTQIGIGQGTGEAVKTSPTSPNAPTGASPAPAPVVKSIIERQKDFAKAYCLQYGWPEALRYLRTYQVRGQADELPVPASVEALSKKKAQLTAEERNLREAHQEILKLKDEADLAIFSPLLVLVDWEEARMTGEGAVKKRNLDLWRFLRTSPYFTSVNRTDLKDYIEWSGVLAREEVREERLFPKEIIETPIEALDLSVRVYNSLKRTGITTVGEVLDLLNKGIEEPLAIRNFGDKSLEELRERLTSKGYLMPNPITEVLERNRDKLMKYPNVVGVGIGEKITGGHPTGRQAIRVYVSRKVPGGILDAHEVLPTQIAGVPTDVVETGDTSVGSGAVKIAK